MSYRHLSDINGPDDLRKLPVEQLREVAEEIRAHIINCISKTGGHLGASLGMVELCIALHYVFDTPRDKLIFDVGHQAYAHKILTGRRDRFHQIVVVAAPDNVQVDRLVRSRGLAPGDARQRLSSQWTTAAKAALADFVIDNGGDLASTEEQVAQVYAALEAFLAAGEKKLDKARGGP